MGEIECHRDVAAKESNVSWPALRGAGELEEYKYNYKKILETRKSSKSVRGMPWLSEAKKDVTSCEKPRGGANSHRSVDIRMGKPGKEDPCHPYANP